MSDALNWRDSYDRTKNRLVLTFGELGIPGLRSFGWQRDISASWPLPDHFHEGALELTFIAEGSYAFRVGGADYCIPEVYWVYALGVCADADPGQHSGSISP